MRKIAFIALILPLLLAPSGLILAQETGSSTDMLKDTIELPKTPLDNIINKWFGSGKLKDTAQQGMNKAQTELKQATGQALDMAQAATKDEISKQANQNIQRVKKTIQAYLGRVTVFIKNNISDAIEKIKLFFSDLFRKKAKTY